MQLTHAGCGAITKLKKVTWLEACGAHLCDEGAATLAAMTQLTHLSLQQNVKITDKSYPALTALQELRSLNISGTSMRAPTVAFLLAMPKLASLSMYGLKASASYAASAMKAFPVVHFSGVQLK